MKEHITSWRRLLSKGGDIVSDKDFDYQKLLQLLDSKFPPPISEINDQQISLPGDQSKLLFFLQNRTKSMIAEAIQEYHRQISGQ